MIDRQLDAFFERHEHLCSISTGAAIIGSAAIGAGASFLGAGEQSDAGEAAAALQMAQYTQTRKDLKPYRLTGYSALNRLSQMFLGGTVEGLDPVTGKVLSKKQKKSGAPDLAGTPFEDLFEDGPAGTDGDAADGAAADAPAADAPSPDYTEFYKSPGYEFRYDEGVNALDKSASARGRLSSGGHERELIRYGQGFASEEFNNYANRLSDLAGIGYSATTAGGEFGATAAANAGNAMINAGTARASGYAGAANALNAGLGNALYDWGTQDDYSGS